MHQTPIVCFHIHTLNYYIFINFSKPRQNILKIAYILNDFPSITQTFVLSQINGVIEKGHEVDLFALRQTKLDTIHDEVHRNDLLSRVVYLPNAVGSRSTKLKQLPNSVIKYSAWKRPIMLLKLLNFAKYRPALKLFFYALPFFKSGCKKYDVIHCQFGTVAPMTLELIEVGALQGKLVTSFRGHDITQDKEISNNNYFQLFKHGNRFLPVSKSLKKLLIKSGCDEDKITILHSGIDCLKFEYKERTLKPNTPIKLLSTARLIEMKGLRYAIEAVSLLIKKGVNISYNIVGEGELKDELQALISHYNVTSNIKLLGWRDHEEVKKLLDESHIFLAPSITAENGEKEGIPNAVKEAMAMGLPIVATYHSGIPELVENNISGFLVAERDSLDLSKKIEQLCLHTDKWPEMSRAARKKIEDSFDIANLTDKLILTYKSIL